MMGYCYFVLALFILLVHGKTLTFVSSTLSVFNDGYGDFTPTPKIVSWIVFVAVLNNLIYFNNTVPRISLFCVSGWHLFDVVLVPVLNKEMAKSDPASLVSLVTIHDAYGGFILFTHMDVYSCTFDCHRPD